MGDAADEYEEVDQLDEVRVSSSLVVLAAAWLGPPAGVSLRVRSLQRTSACVAGSGRGGDNERSTKAQTAKGIGMDAIASHAGPESLVLCAHVSTVFRAALIMSWDFILRT